MSESESEYVYLCISCPFPEPLTPRALGCGIHVDGA